MKKRKRLSLLLNKKTISNLNSKSLEDINGGSVPRTTQIWNTCIAGCQAPGDTRDCAD